MSLSIMMTAPARPVTALELGPMEGDATELRWQQRAFGELAIAELYAILALRQRVFVVEQAAPYLDADGIDHESLHLWVEGSTARPGDRPGEPAILAYLRIVPAGAKYDEASLGRVIVAPEARGTGLGRALVARGLAALGDVPVRIGAQAHLERFYGEFGFRRASEQYLEDGIPHIEMLRA